MGARVLVEAVMRRRPMKPVAAASVVGEGWRQLMKWRRAPVREEVE